MEMRLRIKITSLLIGLYGLLVGVLLASSQDETTQLTGKVVDLVTGHSLMGVNAAVKGTTRGAVAVCKLPDF
ncbi:unnamed protein product [marine sediment metagenome]|uniref:Uncharacterized protein n=1 Tax=marine sediment metagenome TaxID=412755 RepID=X1B3R5_9ZZZZ